MTAHVLPGDTLLIFLELCKDSSVAPAPVYVTVLGVSRRSITVADPDSANGVAKITCHAASDACGKYWYDFHSLKTNKDEFFHVAELQLLNGTKLAVAHFIE